jgi:hypothetical protein
MAFAMFGIYVAMLGLSWWVLELGSANPGRKFPFDYAVVFALLPLAGMAWIGVKLYLKWPCPDCDGPLRANSTSPNQQSTIILECRTCASRWDSGEKFSPPSESRAETATHPNRPPVATLAVLATLPVIGRKPMDAFALTNVYELA